MKLESWKMTDHIFFMSLQGLHQHLTLHARHNTIRYGNRIFVRWAEADDVYQQTLAYLQLSFGHTSADYNQLALRSIQDLIQLRVISLISSPGRRYRYFTRSRDSLVYLYTFRTPFLDARLRSGLRWS